MDFSVSFRFFLFELKRGLIVLCKSLFRLIVVLGLVSLVCIFAFFSLSKTKVVKPMRVGISVSQSDTNTKSLLKFLETQSSVQSIVEFHYLDENQIQSAMESGELDGGILLPEDFYNLVDTGQTVNLKVFIKNDSDNRGIVLGELLSDGAQIITVVESGLFSTYDILAEIDPGRDLSEIGNNLLATYIKDVFGRGGMFTGEVYSSLGKLKAGQYYFLAILITILIVSGLGAAGFYNVESSSQKAVLSIYGVTGTFVSVTRVLVLTLLLTLISAITIMGGSIATRFLSIPGLYFSPLGIVLSLPVCFCIAVFFHFIYSFGKNEKQSQRLLFWINILMIAFSGILIPLAYLNDIFAKAGAFLPTYFWSKAYGFALFNIGDKGLLFGSLLAGIVGLIIVEVKEWVQS